MLHGHLHSYLMKQQPRRRIEEEKGATLELRYDWVSGETFDREKSDDGGRTEGQGERDRESCNERNAPDDGCDSGPIEGRERTPGTGGYIQLYQLLLHQEGEPNRASLCP